MIGVTPAAEPPDFDARVRQPGLRAIGELVGEIPAQRRRGRPRTKVADRREDIPSEAFPPLWRDVLDEMCTGYGRLCAYLALYIERVTGSPSVDHAIPKSKAWNLVYEWPNYRLACALVNSRKGDQEGILDPFEVKDGWFALELVDFQVKPGAAATGSVERKVSETIEKLGLNETDCRLARREYVEAYEQGDLPLGRLERRAPFIARELRRQGKLRPGDL